MTAGNGLERFHIVDDGVAILRVRSRYWRQVKVYRRGEQVFAALGGAFIRLLRGGGTSDPNISCAGVEGPGIDVVAGLPIWRGDA